MLEITASKLIDAYKNHKDNIRHDDSNRTKTRQRDDLAIRFLQALPADFVLIGENVPSNAKDKEKEFLRMNFGSMVEIIIRALYTLEKEPNARKMYKSGANFDIQIGNKTYEIKTCINGSYYNTPVQSEKSILLVAQDGVYCLPKDSIHEYINEKGKLPYKNVDAPHYTKIERLLGYIK